MKKNYVIIIILVILSLFFGLNFNKKKVLDINNEYTPSYDFGDIGGGIIFAANVVNFNNTSMASKNVQNAVDELYQAYSDGCEVGYSKGTTTSGSYTCNKSSAGTSQSIVFDSEDVNYDNTTSGLTSTNVSDAILEIADMIPSCLTNYSQINVTSTSYDCAHNYTLTYIDNLFAATTQTDNGVTATYDEANSYLTLNGTGTAVGILQHLWDFERRTITAGDQYTIIIKYVSGSFTMTDSAKFPRFVFELSLDGVDLSDRSTSPQSYRVVDLPLSGEKRSTYSIPTGRDNTNGLHYWIYDQVAGNTTFTDYKVQILITKVHDKNVVYNSSYGTLDIPTKTGYVFNGWYTDMLNGTQVTSSTTYNVTDDQTVYARYTSNKLNVQYNGNGSDVTWCGTNATYDMDSSKYAIKTADSSRNFHSTAYGQYISIDNGLNNYHYANGVCFDRSGYVGDANEQWVLSTNSNKKYSQTNTSLTAIDMANDANCDLTSGNCTVRLNVNWLQSTYQLNYIDNLFSGTGQINDGVTATYTESNSYLTLNGTTGSSGWIIPNLWNLELRSFSVGDQYQITLNYVSGSITCNSAACSGSARPRFVMDLMNNGTYFSDRGTEPQTYTYAYFPTTSTPASATLTVGTGRGGAEGLMYRVYQTKPDSTADYVTFNNYKVQVLITKVHNKTITYNSAYGTLDTPTKTGYTFDGWYTSPSGGTQVTSSTVLSNASDQTVYAHWTSHKLNIRYQAGNTTEVTWCSSSTRFSHDDSWYAIDLDNSSTRNIQIVPFGQYVSLNNGLYNYHNTNSICFARSGYYAADGQEWVLNGNSNKVYDQEDTTYFANAMALDAGYILAEQDVNMRLNVKWVAKTTPTITLSKSSGYNCKGGTYTYTAKASVAGTFTLSSSNSSNATVSPTTKTVAANTTFTVTVTGKKTAAVTINHSFTPTNTAAYNSTSKALSLSKGTWNATNGGSANTTCSQTGQYARCNDDGTGIDYCWQGNKYHSKCTCGAAS